MGGLPQPIPIRNPRLLPRVSEYERCRERYSPHRPAVRRVLCRDLPYLVAALRAAAGAPLATLLATLAASLQHEEQRQSLGDLSMGPLHATQAAGMASDGIHAVRGLEFARGFC